MAPDPWQWFSPAQIALATGATPEAITANFPRIVAQLALAGINTRPVQRAVIPTVAIETGGPDPALRFTPVREAYWATDDWRKANLDYYPYYGRGFIQRTHRSGYLASGRLIARLWNADPADPTFDLAANPDNLLDPDLSAADLACFWRDTRTLPTKTYPEGYTLVQASEEGDTEWIRRLVQGGTAGLDRLVQIWTLLGDPQPGDIAAPRSVIYDRAYPPIAQNDQWSCWATSARWLLGALRADADGDGQPPTEAYVESQALRDGIESMELGLLVAAGGPGADWLNAHWLSALGLRAVAHAYVTYDDLVARVREGGCLAGGRGWGHWVALTDVTPQGEIAMMNPSPGYMGTGPILTRRDFDRLGPFSCMAVAIGEQEDPHVIADLQQQVAQLVRERDGYKSDLDQLVTFFAQAVDVEGDAIVETVNRQRAYRTQALGPRPTAAAMAPAAAPTAVDPNAHPPHP